MLDIRGILLDIDNTLYEYEPACNAAWTETKKYLAQKVNISPDLADKSLKQAKLKINTLLLNTAASHNRLLQFQILLESLNINPMPHALLMEEIYWNTFLDNMILASGVIDFLQNAKKLNKKICFVTDLTAQIQYRKISKFNLYDYADAIVTSEEIGQDKPHQNMFLYALNKLNLQPNQACMIGDNYSKDVVGAIEHTIKTFWINKTETCVNPQNELIVVVKNFNELLNYLM